MEPSPHCLPQASRGSECLCLPQLSRPSVSLGATQDSGNEDGEYFAIAVLPILPEWVASDEPKYLREDYSTSPCLLPHAPLKECPLRRSDTAAGDMGCLHCTESLCLFSRRTFCKGLQILLVLKHFTAFLSLDWSKLQLISQDISLPERLPAKTAVFGSKQHLYY